MSVTDRERTLGQIVKELTEHISTLFRSEVALLKLELKDTFSKAGAGVALISGAVFLALVGLAFLFVTAVLGMIALGVPAWLSSLIVTVLLFLAAGILALLARKKFAAVQLMPSESIEQVKINIETLKVDIARVRNR